MARTYSQLYDSLKFTFDLSLEEIIFPDDLKISRFNPVFKGGDRSKLGNYRPISVLSCFSNITEQIMYNRFHKCVLLNKILYTKQFGFQVGHSTDDKIIQLDDQIFEAFENNFFTPGVFIDYSKSLRCENTDLKIIWVYVHSWKTPLFLYISARFWSTPSPLLQGVRMF